MTKKSGLAKRKKEMFDFLESNTVARRIEQENNIFRFVDHKDNAFRINTISGKKELKNLIDFNYKTDSTLLDNDKQELLGMLEKVINYIININENTNEVPGFIFLQSQTDFKQSNYDKKVDRIINKQGFNKQKIGNSYFKKPFYDIREFNQANLIIWALHLQTIGDNATKPRYIKYKGLYLPELAMYNPNKQIIEVSNYKHVFSPNKFKKIYECPVCSSPEGIDHSKCKKEMGYYTNYVMQRNDARYLKHIFINKQRKERIIGSSSNESGVRFKPVELNKEFLNKYGSRKLKQDNYKIALIK